MRNLLGRNASEHQPRVPNSGGHRQLTRNTADESRLLSGQSAGDETLIVDARACLRPAQLVEDKLISLLKSVYLPVSHVRTASLCNGRNQFSAPADPERLPRTPLRNSGPEHVNQAAVLVSSVMTQRPQDAYAGQ